MEVRRRTTGSPRPAPSSDHHGPSTDQPGDHHGPPASTDRPGDHRGPSADQPGDHRGPSTDRPGDHSEPTTTKPAAYDATDADSGSVWATTAPGTRSGGGVEVVNNETEVNERWQKDGRTSTSNDTDGRTLSCDAVSGLGSGGGSGRGSAVSDQQDHSRSGQPGSTPSYPDRGRHPDQTGNSDQTGHPDRVGHPDRAGHPDRVGHPDRAGHPDQTSHPDQAGHSDQPGHPDQTGQTENTDRPDAADGPFVAALDAGTTSVRCVVLDRRLEPRATCRRPVQLLYPRPEHVEIDPDQLFEVVCEVIRGAVADAGLTMEQVRCQRCALVP